MCWNSIRITDPIKYGFTQMGKLRVGKSQILDQIIKTGISKKIFRKKVLRFASIQNRQRKCKNKLKHLFWTFHLIFQNLFYLLKLLNIHDKSGIYSSSVADPGSRIPDPDPQHCTQGQNRFHSIRLKKQDLERWLKKEQLKNVLPVNGLFGHAFIHGGWKTK